VDRIGQETLKSRSISIIRWIFGALFLLASLGAIFGHGYISGLLYFLAAIVAIPPASIELEKKLNLKMSGIVRFFVVFIILAFAAVTLPITPVATNNTTAIAAPPSAISGSDTIAVPSKPNLCISYRFGSSDVVFSGQ